MVWKKLRKGPEGWTKLARSFVVRHLQRWLRPDRTKRKKEAVEGPPADDSRSLPRRWASAARAAAMRRVKRFRKRLWEFTKWAVAWRYLPLKRSWRVAHGSGLVSLHQKLYQPDVQGIRRNIRSVKRATMGLTMGSRPILVGPWLSEIGFEILYWIPFLRWAVAYAELDPERLFVVSRGGTGRWYRGIADNYLEIFDRFTPEQFLAGNERRHEAQGGLKHFGVSDFDREVIDWACSQIGVPSCKLLHPSRMYGLYQHFWRKQASVRLLENFSFHRCIDTGTAPPIAGLPSEYVVVKFYNNLALPQDEASSRFIQSFVRELSQSTSVVVLGGGHRFDDHQDLDVEGARVLALDEMDPRENLEVQTRLIHNARAYYGTYGGFSYLAPLCKTKATVFYSRPDGFRIDHLEMARRVFDVLDSPTYLPVDIDDFDRFRKDLAGSG